MHQLTCAQWTAAKHVDLPIYLGCLLKPYWKFFDVFNLVKITIFQLKNCIKEMRVMILSLINK